MILKNRNKTHLVIPSDLSVEARRARTETEE
jgi:hypothetical protein